MLFFDRALLMLSNLLFMIGLYVLVGLSETIMFFAKKIKGSIALFCGLVFIVIGLKFIGVPLQIYGVYEFFKAYAIKFLSYFEFLPIVRPYITRIRQSQSLKKNDDANKV